MSTRIDGTNGIVFPDGTTQATAATSVGQSQSWTNVTANRTAGIAYTNSTGKPIMVAVSVIAYTGTPAYQCYVGGVKIMESSMPYDKNTSSFLVPPGSTYQVDCPNGYATITLWAELR